MLEMVAMGGDVEVCGFCERRIALGFPYFRWYTGRKRCACKACGGAILATPIAAAFDERREVGP